MKIKNTYDKSQIQPLKTPFFIYLNGMKHKGKTAYNLEPGAKVVPIDCLRN